jgi:hypothetical protein
MMTSLFDAPANSVYDYTVSVFLLRRHFVWQPDL